MCVADPVIVEMTGPYDSSDMEVLLNHVLSGEPQCVSTRVDIAPEKKKSNHIKVDEGYKNVGNWNITSEDASALPLVDSFFNLYHFLDVTSAAHAEFFSGNFLMPNITEVQLFSLKATGKFINAPHNRSVISRCLKLPYSFDLAFFAETALPL